MCDITKLDLKKLYGLYEREVNVNLKKKKKIFTDFKSAKCDNLNPSNY